VRILVAEDERKIASLIRRSLATQGFAVDVCANGGEAFALASETPYDALVLDIMMPGRDGLSIVRGLRERKVSTPVLILSARCEISDRVEGLNLGADDYLIKPFGVDELVARIHALVRRASGDKLRCYRVADLHLNFSTRAVSRNARRIVLTAREFNLLECLMRSPGQVFTRSQIHERVWEYHFDPGTNLVDVYIQRLRRKIDDRETVKLIHTIRGVGYSVHAGS
jgi:DNA-binding response OmpR family regulator